MPRNHISHYARALTHALAPVPSLNLRHESFASARLSIRTLTHEDLYDLYECGANPVYTALSYGSMKPFRHLDEAQGQIENILRVAASGYCLPYCIFLEKDGRFLGSATLTIDPGSNQRHRMQIEYGIDPRWWGHGFGTEALRAIILHVFAQPAFGVVKIEGLCVLENEPSIRAMERAGMRRVAVLEQHFAHDGRLHDIAMHAILKRDLPADASP